MQSILLYVYIPLGGAFRVGITLPPLPVPVIKLLGGDGMQPLSWGAVGLHTIASTITSCSRDDMARTVVDYTPCGYNSIAPCVLPPAIFRAGGVDLWLCSIHIYKQTIMYCSLGSRISYSPLQRTDVHDDSISDYC